MEFTFEQDVLPDGSNSMPGEVTELDPPRVFAFAWGEDHLRFELEPVAGGAGCELRLTVGLGTRDKAARDSAGWHVCLDRLERVVAGEDGPAATGASGEWRALYEEYQRRGAPAGAADPGRVTPGTGFRPVRAGGSSAARATGTRRRTRPAPGR